jgi:hypothetical protein
MNISFDPSEDPYSDAICSFMQLEFPTSSISHQNIIEGVVQSFLGTKCRRLGPLPNIESQAEIYKRVRSAIKSDMPIPVLIPGASVKVPPQKDDNIDLAEFAMLQMLVSLQREVQKYYSPGIDFWYRAEDLTELVLSPDTPYIEAKSFRYSTNLEQLAQVLRIKDFFKVIRESKFVSKSNFVNYAMNLIPDFKKYLDNSTGLPNSNPKGEQFLKLINFQGLISPASREFFRARYRRNYPEMPESLYNLEMAKYFAACITRKNLKATGDSYGWALQLSFSPPQPDMPLVAPKVYYRTVPRNHSELHISPWCARGVLKISESGKSRISLLHWWDNQKVTKGEMLLTSGNNKIALTARYMLE